MPRYDTRSASDGSAVVGRPDQKAERLREILRELKHNPVRHLTNRKLLHTRKVYLMQNRKPAEHGIVSKFFPGDSDVCRTTTVDYDAVL